MGGFSSQVQAPQTSQPQGNGGKIGGMVSQVADQQPQQQTNVVPQGGGDGIVYTATLDCKKPYIVTAQDEANTLLQDYKNLIDQGYDSIYDPQAGDWIPFHAENIHITDEESYDGDEESDDENMD